MRFAPITTHTHYIYNAQGKMVKVIQGDQNRYFKYDSLGRLIRVKQPEQEPNDNLDLADSYNPSGKWSAGFKYNALGDLIKATDANGVNIINEYDQAKRVTKRCYTKPNFTTSATNCGSISTNDLSANTPQVEYFYDGFMALGQPPTASPNLAKGKLTRVTSSISETRYTQFDNLGRLLQMQQITDGQTYTSSYEYNFAGALVKETYPSGRVVRNEFESDGDLSRIYGKANQNAIEKTYANGFSYTPDGKIQRLKLGNNRWESAKFNERLQVTELALGTSDGDGSLWKLQYEYGELQSNGTVDTNKNTGNIARQTISFNGLTQPFVQTYKYDSLYRITEATEVSGTTQNWKESYGYDRYGNRLDYHKFVGTTELTLDNKAHPTIDSNTNRFTDTVTFNYDKNGNLIKDGESRNFVFNGENKQTEIKDSNGATIGQYFYDGEGKRIKKVTNTEITIFVYSAGNLVAEYSTATPPTNPTTKWTATDQLGSPRVITDANGQVISRRDFMPFGEEVTNGIGNRSTTEKYGTTDGIRQKFTGYQKDEETLLDFAEARMYENRHGRFTAVDPLLASGKSANPQTFNRYVYVLNNPLIYTDPTGLQVSTNPNDNIPDDPGTERVCNIEAPVCGAPVFPFRVPQRTMRVPNNGATINGYDSVPDTVPGVVLRNTPQQSVQPIPRPAPTPVYPTNGTYTEGYRFSRQGFTRSLQFAPLIIGGSALAGTEEMPGPGTVIGGIVGCGIALCVIAGSSIETIEKPYTIPFPTPTSTPDKNPCPCLVRFGIGPESQERLGDQAKVAQNAGFPYGVSTVLKMRISGTDRNLRWAPLSQVQTVFPGTRQTGNKPNHYTVVFPRVVDQQITDQFNNLFIVRP